MNAKEKLMNDKLVHEAIFKTRENIVKLQKQYDSLKASQISMSDNQLKYLHSEYSRLKAEIKILEESKPETIPKCRHLLLSWAHQVLQKDVKNLEELLSFQENMKKISSEKKLELTKLCKTEQIECDLVEESFTFEELLQNEKLKSEILQCLHRKLIRRLRRISRDYYNDLLSKDENVETNNFSDKPKKQKSMFSILKELFVELRDISATPEEWNVSCCIKTNKTNLQSVQLLLSYNIVEFSHENPDCVKLING